MCTSAHQGVIRGEPIHVMTVQSKVRMDRPMPLLTPKTWLMTALFGAIQHIQLNTDNAWKR